jgi:hypothetical protein
VKKLTNKTDTMNALAAFGVETIGDENITKKGNLKGVVDNEEQLQNNIDSVYKYWQDRGFPYYSTDPLWRKQKFRELENTNWKELLTQDKVIKPNQTGLALAWSYMPHSLW